MAFTTSSSEQNNSQEILKTWQHASRVFVDDQFRLAPKADFMFHVAFNINANAVKDKKLIESHRNEINLLVKSATIPKFEIDVTKANQYNRKKIIQTSHKYENVTIKFHDDNMSIINHLWQNYYSHYYADSTSAQKPGAYTRNATKNYDYVVAPYGLDKGTVIPFFNYITIYQMARHEWISAKLINPVITTWDGSTLDYTSNKTHENSITLAYEAVAYDTGDVETGSPEGFAVEHYDTAPSPLTGQINLTSASPTFVSSQQSNTLSNLVQKVTQVNQAQNTQNLSSTTNPVSNQNSNGSLQGYSFPGT
ncbi:MAG: hypothetical protein RLZZ196_2019 [Bacteroidota bacterium]|jgi:hypothetical protein